MKLLRSWPFRIPDDRNYVVDDVPRLIIDNCDYRSLGEVEDDVLMIEWDIAVNRADLLTFAEVARRTPSDVLVAPYEIPSDLYHLPAPVSAHRQWEWDGSNSVIPVGAWPVQPDDETCNLFGLGMVYLPYALVCGFLDSGYATHFGDVEFSMWHYKNVSRTVPILRSVHPVHVNYMAANLAKEMDS